MRDVQYRVVKGQLLLFYFHLKVKDLTLLEMAERAKTLALSYAG